MNTRFTRKVIAAPLTRFGEGLMLQFHLNFHAGYAPENEKWTSRFNAVFPNQTNIYNVDYCTWSSLL